MLQQAGTQKEKEKTTKKGTREDNKKRNSEIHINTNKDGNANHSTLQTLLFITMKPKCFPFVHMCLYSIYI